MSLPNNIEIQKIFIENMHSKSQDWMHCLFEKLQPLVISRIKNFKTFYHVEDLKQEMNLALWSAIKSFDCHKYFDFYRWSNWHFANASRNFQKKYKPLKSINLNNKIINRQDNILLAKEVMSYKKLSNNERTILYMFFIEEESLASIGLEFGVSAERIHLIKNRAINKIVKYVEINKQC